MSVTKRLFLVQFLIYCTFIRTALLSYCEETTLMIIFGFEPDETRRLLSSLDYSFESNRKVLGQLMKSMDQTVTLMDAIDRRCGKLKNVHDEFRRQAMTIPLLWEKNEILLRYLVSPSNMVIKYGINAPIADPVTIETDADANIEQQQQQNRSAHPFSSESLKVDHGNVTDERTNTKADVFSVPGLSCTSAPPTSSCPLKKCKMDQLSPPSYDSLEQILVHLCRDWSSQGIIIRERLYMNGIVKKLEEYMPVVEFNYASSLRKNHKNASISGDDKDDIMCCNECNVKNKVNKKKCCTRKENNTTGNSKCCSSITIKKSNYLRNSLGIRVLLPGAGLGRLASEIAVRGYDVEANDCSGKIINHLSAIYLRVYHSVLCYILMLSNSHFNPFKVHL